MGARDHKLSRRPKTVPHPTLPLVTWQAEEDGWGAGPSRLSLGPALTLTLQITAGIYLLCDPRETQASTRPKYLIKGLCPATLSSGLFCRV